MPTVTYLETSTSVTGCISISIFIFISIISIFIYIPNIKWYRPKAHVWTHLLCSGHACIPHVLSCSQSVPAFETVARANPAHRTVETTHPRPIQHLHGGTRPTPARWNWDPHHLPRLQMRAAEASVGLRLRHVNHGDALAAATGRRHATPDLLLKHLDETFVT